MTNNSDRLSSFSKIASTLRFPLIMLVICIHAVGSELLTIDLTNFTPPHLIDSIYRYSTELLSHSIARIAVPLFFFISGYYTCYHKDWGSRQIIKQEYSKKLRSLALPYLLWNSLYLILLVAKAQISTSLSLNLSDPFVLEWGGLYHLYWDKVLDYPLWYLRELILLTILTPLLHIVLKRIPYLFLPLAFIAFLMQWPSIASVLSPLAIFCFSIGAFCGQREINPLSMVWKYRCIYISSAIILVLCLPFFNDYPYYQLLENIYILLGSATALIGTHFLIRGKANWQAILLRWNKYVFFIYAVHTIFLVNWARGLVFRIPFLRNDAPGGLIGYSLIIILTLLFSLIVYHILVRLSPKLLALLSGGRA